MPDGIELSRAFVKDFEALEESVCRWEESEKRFSDEMAGLQAENERLKADLAKVTDGKLPQLVSELQVAKKEAEELRQQAEAASRAAADDRRRYKASRRKLQKLEKSLTALDEEKKRLESQLENSVASAVKPEEVARLEETVESLQSEMRQLESEKKELTGKIRRLEQGVSPRIQDLERELAKTQEDVEYWKSQYHVMLAKDMA